MAQKRRGGRGERELGRERLNNLEGSADKAKRPVILPPQPKIDKCRQVLVDFHLFTHFAKSIFGNEERGGNSEEVEAGLGRTAYCLRLLSNLNKLVLLLLFYITEIKPRVKPVVPVDNERACRLRFQAASPFGCLNS